MKICLFSKSIVAALTALLLVLGAGGAATIALAPDAAFAKSDKSNGKGKGRDKADRGKGNGRDKAERGSKGKAQSERSRGNEPFKSAKDKWKKNGKKSEQSGVKQAGNARAVGPKSLADLGRQFERDVRSLFGRERTEERPQTRLQQAKPTQVRRASAPDRSPRPAARPLAAVYTADKDRVRPKWRDPLVAAITDPNGSDKLRNLNASNAAAPAIANASPNSNVGKIATYQDAAEAYYVIREDLIGARRDLRKLDESYVGRTSEEINEDIGALDPNDPDFEMKQDELQNELADAQDYEVQRDELQDDIVQFGKETFDTLEVAEDAFFDASRGRTLTRAALGDFHENLDLPKPGKRTGDYAYVTPLPEDKVEIQPVSTDMVEIQPYPRARPKPREGHNGRYRDPLVAAITDPNGSDRLRNLNASNAAAPAIANASPNSNVGKIATYQDAAEAYYVIREDLIGARRDLRKLDESYDGHTSEEIMEDIEALDPNDPDFEMKLEDFEEELADAEAFEAARNALQADLRNLRRDSLFAAKEAEAAFYEASKAGTLTKAALADFHSNLGLPAPIR